MTHTISPHMKILDFSIENLPHDLRNVVLTDWVRADNAMRQSGITKPIVDGELPIKGSSVVAQTDKGEVVGQVVDYGIVRDTDSRWLKSVWIYVASSGSVFNSAPRFVRPADDEHKARLQREVKMASRLPDAIKKAEEKVATVRAKKVPGSHLLIEMMARCQTRGLTVVDQTGFHKVTGSKKGRAVYVGRKGGACNLSGFSVDHPAIVSMSEDEARKRHLGTVRGQLDFDKDDAAVLEAFNTALEEIK